jgi:hypothetical protein
MMSVLTTKKRAGLRAAMFGLPSQRKYPMPDRSHAANAKARAHQQLNKGNLGLSQYKTIVAKANRKLGSS